LEINIAGEGANSLPADPRNAIYSAMHSLAENCHVHMPEGMQINCRNNIPLGSGLGSSAAAAVAGVLAVNCLFDLQMTLQEELDFAAALEGHPDNAAPCLLGGMTACMQSEQGVTVRKLPVKAMPLLVVLPSIVFPTQTARGVLPHTVPLKDAVFNISRTVMVTQALQDGDVDLLREAMHDRLHQPYRLPLIPGAQQAMDVAYQAGAAGVALSGAGPALLVVCCSDEDREPVAEAMRKQFSVAGITMRYFLPSITTMGAACILLD
jgi:homoserine kinase